MKTKLKKIEVDFIGEQNRPLSEEEQRSISAFIKKLKAKQKDKRKSLKKLNQRA
ncbi:MAG: hypothetical protein IPM74_05720 [Crocinitomicaceae bacterium]|nr:hypothetical protein [Crocinitomicaceae bacterium]MBK8925402.1 hypothetical protein [Crocinitomicaceae bacterium]